jgi:hypothetical protein
MFLALVNRVGPFVAIANTSVGRRHKGSGAWRRREHPTDHPAGEGRLVAIGYRTKTRRR